MRKVEKLDELDQQIFDPLRKLPIDAPDGGQSKANFLLRAESYRKELEMGSVDASGRPHLESLRNGSRHPLPLVKLLAGALLALLILVGSSASVFASQESLPGEALYLVKSLTEDIQLKMASSPQSKLDLTLNFTDRRLGEIATLVTDGKDLPDQASHRLSGELESALQLAAQLDDTQIISALGKIKNLAERQGLTLEELINVLPDQANPAILHLKQRLQEQVELSTIGVNDPQAFRSTIRERQSNKPSISSDNPGNNPTASTPHPEKPSNGNGHDNGNPPSNVPGNNAPGEGNGGANPGNGNDKPGKTPAP